VRNVSVAVREHKGEIVFLRRVVAGGANRSYGIDVARLAGLPTKVIGRAREIMSRLEGGSQLGTTTQLSLGALAPAAPASPQLALGATPQLPLGITAQPSPIVAKLSTVDINRMTPLEALTLLAELKSLL
jgi:DNA mismatch repair protein MutS